jgi:hypothetical protein
MKNFIAIFNVSKISETTLQYAVQVTKSAGAHLVGLFLDESIFYQYSGTEEKTINKEVDRVQKLSKDEEKIREEAKRLFQKSCEEAEIQFSFHKEGSMTLRQLKSESMYADLMVVDKHETFTSLKEKPPTHFIKDLLADLQCPVLVVPALYKPIENLVLLYDGGPTALYALKMFSYVLGNPQNLPVKVFTVKEKRKTEFYMPDNKKIREFAKRHFPKATFAAASGNAEQEISGYLSRLSRNQLVVLGAYQRSEISRWFKISMADVLMKESETPLFIAHNSK